MRQLGRDVCPAVDTPTLDQETPLPVAATRASWLSLPGYRSQTQASPNGGPVHNGADPCRLTGLCLSMPALVVLARPLFQQLAPGAFS
jgi:hypothetical protein